MSFENHERIALNIVSQDCRPLIELFNHFIRESLQNESFDDCQRQGEPIAGCPLSWAMEAMGRPRFLAYIQRAAVLGGIARTTSHHAAGQPLISMSAAQIWVQADRLTLAEGAYHAARKPDPAPTAANIARALLALVHPAATAPGTDGTAGLALAAAH